MGEETNSMSVNDIIIKDLKRSLKLRLSFSNMDTDQTYNDGLGVALMYYMGSRDAKRWIEKTKKKLARKMAEKPDNF